MKLEARSDMKQAKIDKKAIGKSTIRDSKGLDEAIDRELRKVPSTEMQYEQIYTFVRGMLDETRESEEQFRMQLADMESELHKVQEDIQIAKTNLEMNNSCM